MAILRKSNKERYTTVPQELLRDGRLSLRDIGLLVSMLALPDNWEFSENGLIKIFKNDGQTSIRSGLKNLENAGYLLRVQVRGVDGKISGVSWYLSDSHEFDEPHFENPNMVNANLENRPQYNTKEYNTKESNTKRDNTDQYIQSFNEFWNVYPNKKAKEAAKKAWLKLKPDESLKMLIIDAVNKDKQSKGWLDAGGKYIPYPATYINGKRWEDEETVSTRTETHDPNEDLGDLLYREGL